MVSMSSLIIKRQKNLMQIPNVILLVTDKSQKQDPISYTHLLYIHIKAECNI